MDDESTSSDSEHTLISKVRLRIPPRQLRALQSLQRSIKRQKMTRIKKHIHLQSVRSSDPSPPFPASSETRTAMRLWKSHQRLEYL
jgi:hypothetical protein